jgi:hypothetical protein
MNDLAVSPPLSALSASPGTFESPCAGLMAAVVEAIGPVACVDATFPGSLLAREAPDAVQLLPLPREPGERDFLARFRQAGGHAPVAALDLRESAPTWPPAWAPASHRKDLLIALDGPDAFEIAGSLLTQPSLSFLLPVDEAIPAQACRTLSRAPCDAWLLHDVNSTSEDPLYLLVRSADPSTSAANWPRVRRQIWFEPTAGHSEVHARNLVHDGGHACEGDAGYSWLWTGPSPHFRFILPAAGANHAGRAEICVAQTEDPANLDDLAVQVNGRPVPFSIDRWSRTSGKVVFGLPDRADYIVVTLVVPRLRPDGNSGRLLGLCLDKVILAP